ncbi:MAG: hypothetical protein ACI9J3_002383 [Parvicellaceae bacterium]|jgi:hypothetical protein
MKYVLEEEYDYDFKLIGISCHAKDYRLAWAINKELGYRMEKEEYALDILSNNPLERSEHPVYSFYDEDEQNEYFLIGNRVGAGYLIPELRQADFVFMIKASLPVDVIKETTNLRKIALVLTAFEIDVAKLKSKKNLIF